MNPPVTAAQLGSTKNGSRQEDSDILTLSFDDNRLLSLLCGEHDENLAVLAPVAENVVVRAELVHNHFVSSQQKVRQPQYLYRQNLLLREHALGDFGVFLHAIARDPAMVIYLDSASNRKGQPNENFAREVMELFTLGEGHYSERDIKEAARAFTGMA